MAAFAYSAINAVGAELSGEITAQDLSAAREQLRMKGLLAQAIQEIDDGAHLRHPRADRNADVPSPRLRRDLRAARRPASDADALRREGFERPQASVVHRLPGHVRDDLRHQAIQADGGGAAELGQAEAAPADEDRRRRPQGDDGAVLAHALDAR